MPTHLIVGDGGHGGAGGGALGVGGGTHSVLTCLPATLAAPVQRSGAQNILQSSDLFRFVFKPNPRQR